MLYATTRSKLDTYTNLWAQRDDAAPDGGLFVPVLLPKFSTEEIRALKDRSAGETIAQILNRFFSCRFTGGDVEFAIGRNFFRLMDISHRITIAETWHNPDGDFSWIVRALSRRMASEHGIARPSEWMGIAVRIAVLFALFGDLERRGIVGPARPLDVAVTAGDFSGPMAAWYARKMGLPVGTIVCCCNENGGIWDLLRRGQMKLDPRKIETITPECDIPVPRGLERLISSTLGEEEVREFNRIRAKGGTYEVNPEQHRRLGEGMYASVVSSKRLLAAMPNAYRTHGCVLCPYGALVYSGLMDYRAMSGKNGPALMLCERSPLNSGDTVTKALGISNQQLRDLLGFA